MDDGDGAAQPPINRFLSDPEVPHTTVVLRPSRAFGAPWVTEMLQQAVAFPALIAVTGDDALVVAIDAVYHAAIAHGDGCERFLADAHIALV